MDDHALRQQLETVLHKTLPDCQLQLSAPPLCPRIKLALLAPTLPTAPLPHETMLKVLETPAYWSFCWASGQVLASYLRQHPEIVADRRVVDFGAGSGIVGIAAKLAGAAEVLAIDSDPDALAACRINAALNNVTLKTLSDLSDLRANADLIIAADVLYDRDNFPLLDELPKLARRVLIADSRIKQFSHPCYHRIGEQTATTWPDLEEHPEYNLVRIFESILFG